MKIINLGNRVVNNYIYSTNKGYVLVDPGYEGSYKQFSINGKVLDTIGFHSTDAPI